MVKIKFLYVDMITATVNPLPFIPPKRRRIGIDNLKQLNVVI